MNKCRSNSPPSKFYAWRDKIGPHQQKNNANKYLIFNAIFNISKWHDPRIKEILGKNSPPLQKWINVEATVRQANSMLDGAVTNQLIAL